MAASKAERLAARQRTLTQSELRLLRARAAAMRKSGGRAARKGVVAGVALVVLLYAWTLLASDAPAAIITLFWLIVGGAIVLAVRRSLVGEGVQLDSMAKDLESAMRRNLADVYDIRATRFVEFEEIEDEGACFAFELADSRVVFLSGQQFYETASFPSLDFSLVMPLDEGGRRVDEFIAKGGPKARPERLVPARVKETLHIPDDLELVAGPLSTVEERLRQR